ncbi:MAG: hypothetical protein IJA67_02155 [Oscillospiraceae bacterium]|nr:hypothetical protein [Oscillospiraceae bacterium]
MKFIGLFGGCYFLIFLALNIIWPLFENIYGIVGIAAFLMALVLRLFMGQSDRLDELEVRLTLANRELKTLKDQLNEKNKEDCA